MVNPALPVNLPVLDNAERAEVGTLHNTRWSVVDWCRFGMVKWCSFGMVKNSK